MPHHHTEHVSAGFFDLWSPFWMVTIILLIIGYLVWCNHRVTERVSFKQKFFFITGLVTIFIAEGTPLSYYGHHYVFSFHMIQMALMYLVVPPLLLLGMPASLLKPLLLRSKVKKVVWFMSNPLIAILLFNMLFSFYHIPSIFDTAMKYDYVHIPYHILLFASAMLMYWLIVGPVPELNRLSPLMKLAYIFGNGVLLTPACALIIFSDQVLYSTYANATQLFESLPPIEDQQLGGTLMKIIQEIVYGTALGAVFYSWARKEKAKDKEELEAIQAANLTPRMK